MEKKNTIEPTHLDEMKRFSIHKHEFAQLPKNFQKLASQYEDIVYYADLTSSKQRVAKAKQLLKKYAEVIKKNKGKETGEECLYVGMIIGLMDRMYASEIRKLNLHKITK